MDRLPPWEEQALAALDAGDIDKAFRLLEEGCQQAIIAFCITKIRDTKSGRDVACEVFAAAWEALPRFRRESSLRTWMFSIASHTCANYWTAIWHFYKKHEPIGEDQPDPAELLETVVIKQQQHEGVQRVLSKLRRKERELLIMRYIAKQTLEEIAERYSVSRETIRKQVLKAEKKFKQIMDQ